MLACFRSFNTCMLCLNLTKHLYCIMYLESGGVENNKNNQKVKSFSSPRTFSTKHPFSNTL
uniref:Uncharacterized protein n=1 Tax=Anguilla anguilla TaxID=7936 RepID=A0A0E9T6I3_ANGAN